MKKYIFIIILILSFKTAVAQDSFSYDVQLTPIAIANLPGLHSYVFAQHNGKWLVIGGRKDGIHARQPFNAFPQAQNNTDIYVIDINTKQLWSASLNLLSSGIAEQLQSTNMNFYQDENTLYIIGGYAFSATANNHITFDKLTSVDVPNLITAVIAGTPITTYFKQISDAIFQNTGGQLGKIGTDFYLIGGQVFTGRYNPNNGGSFVQSYTSQIQKFTIDNSGMQLSYGNYSTVTDAINLHRRDYNLVPQVFPNGEEGYTISSGVFQINEDLPFLYPVDIKSSGYFPQTQFNQYLSNYHSGKVGLYDQTENQMHTVFFGGISQYYYNGTTLIQDNNVPFVKTISRVTRLADGTLKEYNLPVEMPNLKGAGAEFIPNTNLPHYDNDVIKLSQILENEFIIGHIYGGIQSPTISSFTDNKNTATSADPTVYEVKLIKNNNLSVASIDGKNPFTFTVSPIPIANKIIKIQFNLPYVSTLDYFISSIDGKIVNDGEIEGLNIGNNTMNFSLENANTEMIILTFIFDHKFYVSQKVYVK
ncbi:hypothetical protein H8R23_10220 [Flavobacterium sp. F-380]|uniref:T9SS C-terminal target domain-containing protein n=1 Tax=Flavobacterium kayseriense TaxID=2764714 RepID=A0ABR7J8A8_9FLAO|nr:hypothetical protein [Flavobacterium kayseriense]MBC5841781.1 hypothetical protein [Flavobacterium kayseriense]MBC5848310.1 hypothetical protein [Flavobacterium kayseriense]